MSNTLQEIQQLVVSELGVPVEMLAADRAMSDSGLDSLSQAELLFLIEEHFNIQIPNEQPKVSTLLDLANLIDDLKAKSIEIAPASN